MYGNMSIKLSLGNSDIENITEQKLLGVYIDNSLTWKTQITKVCSIVNSKIALFKRISYYLTDEMKIKYYNAYIVSSMDYCCTIWGTGKQCMNKMYKLQCRAARLITNTKRQESNSNLLRQLNWLSFEDRCFYHSGVLVYKAKNLLAPEYIYNMLTFCYSNVYNLRSIQRNDIEIPKQRTNYMKMSFTNYSAHTWNSIPTSIRNSPSLVSFKKALKKYLLNK